jgi:Ca2+-binding EF-hand superfamily protein
MLGMPGYQAYVKGLSGPLEKFNGTVCEPRRLSSDQFTAVLTNRGETFELAGTCKFFTAFRRKQSGSALCQQNDTEQSTTTGNTTNLNNRSSVGVAFSSMCMEIMRAINQKGKDASSVLTTFDANGDGYVDQEELLKGCNTLGILVSAGQIEMVWSMFQPDPKTGDILLNMFLSTVQGSASVNKNMAAAQQQAQSQYKATKLERAKRIQHKSMLMKLMTDSSARLRNDLRKIMEAQSMSAADLFSEIDSDEGGTIDQFEFRSSLQRHDINLSATEIDLLWPTICPGKGE